MSSSGDPGYVSGLLVGLMTNVVWAAIAFGGKWISPRIALQPPKRRRLLFVASLLLDGIVLLLALWILSKGHHSDLAGWILVILGAAWAVFTCLRELMRFWQVGILGADREVRSGLSHAKALNMVRAEISFLGTGAAKLSALPEFEAALRRCRSDIPIRLLLRRPNDPALEQAAARADKPRDAYSKTVVQSLRSIASLKESIENIQVRFYSGDLVFRVLLIDRRVALVSFNIYGVGDGSQLPQIHLASAPEGHEVHKSFFHAFERYFNEHWDTATAWDFTEYL